MIRVTDIRFAPARPELRQRGLRGWVCCTLDGSIQLDGLGVRKTLRGEYAVSFPSRRDANGTEHPIVKPLDAETRAAIERPILNELQRRGFLS